MRSLCLLPLLVLCACASSKSPEAVMPRVDAPGRAGAFEAERAIVRTASLEVERKDPASGPTEAAALAKAHGGYAQRISSEDATVRVPVERLDAFLAAAATLGEVAKRTVTAEDVTDARRDLKVRFENLARVRERYLELLQRATTVEDTVKVERELERVTAEYESLKARLEALEGEVALATVSLEFHRPVRPGPVGWIFYGLAKGVKWLFIWE